LGLRKRSGIGWLNDLRLSCRRVRRRSCPHIHNAGAEGFVKKLFSISMLAEEVRKALEGKYA